MTLFVVALAGGVGAVLRYLLGVGVERINKSSVPLGTAAANVTGAFALGLLTSFAAQNLGFEDLNLVLGLGVLGGYTTFSAASVESADLAAEGGWKGTARSILLSSTTLLVSVLAGLLGLALGSS